MSGVRGTRVAEETAMRIVTYNVFSLRARLVPPRTLKSFLDSLESDIICLQETKLTRQELTAEIAVADGYESFFSCTRTVSKGRVRYSGVATFCRTPTAVPVAADEGFTGAQSSTHQTNYKNDHVFSIQIELEK